LYLDTLNLERRVRNHQGSSVTRALRAAVLRRAASSWLRRQEAAHLRHRWSLRCRLVYLRLKSELQPLQSAKYNLPQVLVAHPRWQYKAIMATTSAHPLRSNWSFNRTANGVPPWPRGSVVHHLPRGQGATPSSAG
jgi:hypothetical protein